MKKLEIRRKTTRINLELSPDAYTNLCELKELTGSSSMVEVIRKSLAVYHMILENFADDSGTVKIFSPKDEKCIHLVLNL